MRPIVTNEGIDEALKNLRYSNKNSLKSKLINTIIEQYHLSGEGIDSVSGIDTDFLVKTLWETGDDPELIRSRRKNFNSIKSTVNSDLKKLYNDGQNKEGIIINQKNIFDMCDEAKSEMLESFSYGGKGNSQIPLDKITDVLSVINDFISNKESDIEENAKFEQLKELIRDISGKVGISIVSQDGNAGAVYSARPGETSALQEELSGSDYTIKQGFTVQENSNIEADEAAKTPEDEINEEKVDETDDQYEELELEDLPEEELEESDKDEVDIIDEPLEEPLEEVDELEDAALEELEILPDDEIEEELLEGDTEEVAEEEIEEILDADEEGEESPDFEDVPIDEIEELPADEIVEEPVDELEDGEFEEVDVEEAPEDEIELIEEPLEESVDEVDELEEIPEEEFEEVPGEEEELLDDDIEEVSDDEMEDIPEEEIEDEPVDELEGDEYEEIEVEDEPGEEVSEEELEELPEDESDDALLEDVEDIPEEEIVEEPVEELEDDEFEEVPEDDLEDEIELIEEPIEESADEVDEVEDMAEEELEELPEDEIGEEPDDEPIVELDDFDEIPEDELEEVPEDEIDDLLEDDNDYTLETILNDYDTNGYLSEEGQEKALFLADRFDKMLSDTERYYNRYLLVPGGRFLIVNTSPKIERKSQNYIDLSDFYFGKFPVTNHLFELFIEKTGYVTTAERLGYGMVYKGRYRNSIDETSGRKILEWNSSLNHEKVDGANWFQPHGPGSTLRGKKNHPVVQVTLEDAMAFAAWTGKRLPTEQEWDAAARTSSGLDYPWGRKPDKEKCNIEASAIGDTTPVDKYHKAVNKYEIYDLLGNVMEWTSSSESQDGNIRFVVKGGSWVSGDNMLLTSRSLLDPKSASNIVGFRCIAYR